LLVIETPREERGIRERIPDDEGFVVPRLQRTTDGKTPGILRITQQEIHAHHSSILALLVQRNSFYSDWNSASGGPPLSSGSTLSSLFSLSRSNVTANLTALEVPMAVAKITEISSESPKSFEDAINTGIARAEKTLRNLTGAWIKSQKVVITKGKITEYRVLLKVTFVLTD
jgi:flavin-binding protein dodecin